MQECGRTTVSNYFTGVKKSAQCQQLTFLWDLFVKKNVGHSNFVEHMLRMSYNYIVYPSKTPYFESFLQMVSIYNLWLLH